MKTIIRFPIFMFALLVTLVKKVNCRIERRMSQQPRFYSALFQDLSIRGIFGLTGFVFPMLYALDAQRHLTVEVYLAFVAPMTVMGLFYGAVFLKYELGEEHPLDERGAFASVTHLLIVLIPSIYGGIAGFVAGSLVSLIVNVLHQMWFPQEEPYWGFKYYGNPHPFGFRAFWNPLWVVLYYIFVFPFLKIGDGVVWIYRTFKEEYDKLNREQWEYQLPQNYEFKPLRHFDE